MLNIAVEYSICQSNKSILPLNMYSTFEPKHCQPFAIHHRIGRIVYHLSSRSTCAFHDILYVSQLVTNRCYIRPPIKLTISWASVLNSHLYLAFKYQSSKLAVLI